MAFDPHDTNANRDTPINTPTQVGGQVILLPYDPAWPKVFASEARHIRGALGDAALLIEHIGSTSVPGLCAKPCIDILLAVKDSSDESSYAPQLDSAGFVLRMRHPDWNEHRVFKSERINVNLHVWSAGSGEIERHLRFRDWLRGHPEDRERYACAKHEAASQYNATMDDYNDKKAGVIQDITNRMNQTTVS